METFKKFQEIVKLIFLSGRDLSYEIKIKRLHNKTANNAQHVPPNGNMEKMKTTYFKGKYY